MPPTISNLKSNSNPLLAINIKLNANLLSFFENYQNNKNFSGSNEKPKLIIKNGNISIKIGNNVFPTNKLPELSRIDIYSSTKNDQSKENNAQNYNLTAKIITKLSVIEKKQLVKSPQRNSIKLQNPKFKFLHLLALQPYSKAYLSSKLGLTEKEIDNFCGSFAKPYLNQDEGYHFNSENPSPNSNESNTGKYILKDESYKELVPYEWILYTDSQRKTIVSNCEVAFDKLGLDVNHYLRKNLIDPSATEEDYGIKRTSPNLSGVKNDLKKDPITPQPIINSPKINHGTSTTLSTAIKRELTPTPSNSGMPLGLPKGPRLQRERELIQNRDKERELQIQLQHREREALIQQQQQRQRDKSSSPSISPNPSTSNSITSSTSITSTTPNGVIITKTNKLGGGILKQTVKKVPKKRKIGVEETGKKSRKISPGVDSSGDDKKGSSDDKRKNSGDERKRVLSSTPTSISEKKRVEEKKVQPKEVTDKKRRIEDEKKRREVKETTRNEVKNVVRDKHEEYKELANKFKITYKEYELLYKKLNHEKQGNGYDNVDKLVKLHKDLSLWKRKLWSYSSSLKN